jgi:hypothetical protein
MIEFFRYKGEIYRDCFTLSIKNSCCGGGFAHGVCYNPKGPECSECLLKRFDANERILERVPKSDIFLVSEKFIFLIDEVTA